MTRKRRIAGAIRKEFGREINLTTWEWIKLIVFLGFIVASILLPFFLPIFGDRVISL